MKFGIAVNMERLDPSQDMVTLNREALELVKIADQVASRPPSPPSTIRSR